MRGDGQDRARHRRVGRHRQGFRRAARRAGLRAGADRAARAIGSRRWRPSCASATASRRTPSSPTWREPDASPRIVAELRQRAADDRRAGEQRRLRRARQLRQRAVGRARALHAGDGDGGAASSRYRLLPGMIERGWGRIINVASVAGLVPAPAGHTLYGASKAFVIRFSEALAAENAPNGVQRHRGVPRLHAERVPRRHRHARQDEQDAGVPVARCRRSWRARATTR